MQHTGSKKTRESKKPVIETMKNKKGEVINYRVRKSVNGKRVVKRFKNLSEAEAYIATLELERYRVLKVPADEVPKMPIKAIFAQWKTHKLARTSAATFYVINTAFKKYWRDTIGDKALHEITLNDFDAVIAETTYLSRGRVAQIARIVSELNYFAKKRLNFTPNRTLQFEIDLKDIRSLGNQNKAKIIFLRSEHIPIYIKEMRANRHRQTWLCDMNELLLATGVRIGEAIPLKWTDIDEANEVLIIQTHISRIYDVKTDSYTYGILPGTKTGPSREVTLTDDIWEILQRLRVRWERIIKKYDVEAGEYIFIPENPRWSKLPYISYHNTRNSLSYAMKKSHFPGITPHKLRHSWATDFISTVGKIDGNAPKYAQGLLGHSSSVMTDKYTHLTSKDASDAMKKYSELKKERMGINQPFDKNARKRKTR